MAVQGQGAARRLPEQPQFGPAGAGDLRGEAPPDVEAGDLVHPGHTGSPPGPGPPGGDSPGPGESGSPWRLPGGWATFGSCFKVGVGAGLKPAPTRFFVPKRSLGAGEALEPGKNGLMRIADWSGQRSSLKYLSVNVLPMAHLDDLHEQILIFDGIKDSVTSLSYPVLFLP